MSEQPFDPLLAELADVMERADPVPPNVVAAAKAAYVWRTIDAELAELAADSLLQGAGVRTRDAARLLTFRAPGLEVEVEVAATGTTRRLTGQLVPVGPAEITVRWPDGSTTAQADAMGRFGVESVPAGTVSLAIRRPDAERAVVTSWLAI